MLNYVRKYKVDDYTSDWRDKFMVYAQLVPAVCLLIDFTMNKIKIRMSHLKFLVIFHAFYFASTVFAEKVYMKPVLIDNLNWFCA